MSHILNWDRRGTDEPQAESDLECPPRSGALHTRHRLGLGVSSGHDVCRRHAAPCFVLDATRSPWILRCHSSPCRMVGRPVSDSKRETSFDGSVTEGTEKSVTRSSRHSTSASSRPRSGCRKSGDGMRKRQNLVGPVLRLWGSVSGHPMGASSASVQPVQNGSWGRH